MAIIDELDVRLIQDNQWDVARWLWQAYRADMATAVGALPYSDGRYQARKIDKLPCLGTVGYIVWRAHPNTGADAPVAFALVEGLDTDVRSIGAFWVAPVVRREGIGKRFAVNVIGRHPGSWTITFQHENNAAAGFWRHVADEVFGADNWCEEQLPVPERPGVAPDHWIRTLA